MSGNPLADGVGTGLHRWAENMSAAGRRQATRVAIAKLGDWTNGHNEERPSRGEVKAWVVLLRADRQALLGRVSKAERELDAVVAQRDDALEEERVAREASTMYWEEADRLRAELAAVRTAYDEAEGERNELARVAAERERMIIRLQAVDERRNPPASAGELRRLAGFGRASCSCTPGGGAK